MNKLTKEIFKYPPIRANTHADDLYANLAGRFDAIVTRKQTFNHWIAYVYLNNWDYVTGRGENEYEALRSLEGELKRVLWFECMNNERKMC